MTGRPKSVSTTITYNKRPHYLTFSFKCRSFANYFLCMPKRLLFTTTCMLLFSGLLYCCLAQTPSGSFTKGSYFVGPLLTYNKRSAFIDFESIKTSVAVERPDLVAFGLFGGIRLPFLRILRFQLGLGLDAANSTDDTIYTTRTVLDKYYYYHASLEPSLHCALAPPNFRVAPFVVLSAGGNVVYVNERTFFLDEPNQEVLYEDRKYVNEVSVSVNVCAGLGLDFRVSNNVGISLVSTFRFLYPVSYRIPEDFLLYSMKYTETLYGNVTWLGVTFSMK
jgi:hypothetical protein